MALPCISFRLMSLKILWTIISLLHQVDPRPEVIFSFRNDQHDHIRQLLHTNCSVLNVYSSLYICSNEIFSHIPLHLDLFLAPYQSKSNRCALIIKFRQITISEQQQQLILPIDSDNWNKSLIIFIYNNHISKMNYCSFRLLPIGINCSFIVPIEPYNVSCFLNMKLTKSVRIENDQKYFYMIHKLDQNDERKKSNQHLLALFLTIFIFTISPLVLFLGNIIYIE